MKQLQIVAREGLEPAIPGLQVRRPNHSATLPPQIIPFLYKDYIENNLPFKTLLFSSLVNSGLRYGTGMILETNVASKR